MAKRTQDVDFISVGGGLGGLAGALVAADRGMEALIIEKSDLTGGVAAYSGGVVWAPVNHLMTKNRIEDNLTDATAYLNYLGGDGTTFWHDQDLRNTYLSTMGRVVEYLTEQLGVEFRMTGLPDQYHPQGPGSRPIGRSLEAVVETAELGEWAETVRRSPYCPPGATHFEDRETLVGGRQVAIFNEQGDLGALPVLLTKGMGLVGAFVRSALVSGRAAYANNTKAAQLLWRNGQCIGVRAVDAEGEVELRARCGVLLATGSYGYAPYAAAMDGLPSIAEMSPPVTDGDVLKLTDGTPAALVRAGNAFTTVGFQSRTLMHPGTDVPLQIPLNESLGLPHLMVVNAEGRRFGDESFYGAFSSTITWFDGYTKRFPNFPAYLIVGDEYRARYGGISTLDYWPADDLVMADTPRELAAKLGLPGDTLDETVARFNQHAAHGDDPEFGRGQLEIARTQYGDASAEHPNLGVISPPYWGVRLDLLGVGIHAHGVAIDSNARVLTRDRRPIPGLYATGNAVAYCELPFGYESGFANGRNILYGCLSAEHASDSGRRGARRDRQATGVSAGE